MRQPEGARSPAHPPARTCGAHHQTDPFHPGDVLCHKCGTFNKNIVTFCNSCGDPVGLNLKYDVAECEERGMTYAAPLKVTIRLTVFDKDPETGTKTIRDIKEQEVYFGEIPLMTENGTFIINGTERVIVSQLHRSPGVFFESTSGAGLLPRQDHPLPRILGRVRVRNKNILYVRIDRKRKFYGTVFLRALGLKTDERDHQGLLQDRSTSPSRIRSSSGKSSNAAHRHEVSKTYAIQQGQGRHRRHAGQEDHQLGLQRHPEAGNRPRSKSRPKISKAPSPPPTSSTWRPAKSSSRPTTS